MKGTHSRIVAVERLLQQFQVLDLWFTPAIRLQQSKDGALRIRLWRTHHRKDWVLYVGKILWI